jgi:hypothetical protein
VVSVVFTGSVGCVSLPCPPVFLVCIFPLLHNGVGFDYFPLVI